MLIQALADYADTRLQGQLEDPAFERKPVPLLLEISKDGRFLGFIPHEETVTRGKKSRTQPRERIVPKSPVNRNSGTHPLLAFDDAKYLFGPGPWTKPNQEADHREKHEAFVALLGEAARVTGDEALSACVGFYESPAEVEKARAAFDAKVTGGILLSVSPEGPVVDRLAAKEFWRAQFDRKSAARNEKGGTGMCLVTGRVGSIAPTHDLIKGATALGGQPSGVALMSFDKESFRSYGWDKNANSPVSPERARAYVLALNHLMGGFDKSRVDHNGVGFLYWTRKPECEDVMFLLEKADPEAVRRVLQLHEGSIATVEPNDFYLLAVSGNGGRLLVRSWFHDSLDKVLHNVSKWFDDLRIWNVFTGEVSEPPPFWLVLKSLARDEPPADREVQLIRRAITGAPVGKTILAGALSRLRVASGSDRFSPVRAGVIRLAVNDQSSQKGESPLTERLDAASDHEAYLCGRLLAVYDSLQYAAHEEEVGVTIADRYFSLASTYPAVAFPRIMQLGQKHLAKLRRNEDRRSAFFAIEKQIQSLLSRLATGDARFPGRLSLEDQGRFAIGFHHQRAEGMAQVRERKQKKEQGESQ
ncbi:MAG: type I-C CRISPR-associated protein Cas8c/Csd1 [Bryobacteraceae bacterium]